MAEKLDDMSRRALLSSPVRTHDFTTASALVRTEIAARSHRGRVLKENEDHYLVVRLGRYEETLLTSLADLDVPPRFDEYAYAAVVADGIGGGGAGAVAARLAISTLAQLEVRFGQWDMRIDPQIASDIMDRSRLFYRRTHEAVLSWYRAHHALGRIAATLTATYSAGDHLFVANVGHSRCYLFRHGRLSQLTRDQTLRERLANRAAPISVGRGLEDVQHILTDSIGADVEGPRVTVEHFRLVNDDCLLLCTNGLTDMVPEDDIAETLASRRTPEEQCDVLVDMALTSGGHDNVTVVLTTYHIPALPEDGA